MTDVFADPDDPSSSITLSVIDNSDTHLVSAVSMDGKILNYTVHPGDQGIVVLTVKAKAGIRTALTTVTMMIGKPPYVANPIPGVAVTVNSAPVTRDLTNTFTDPDASDPADQIVKTLENNSNPGLVTPSIAGNTLTLTFAPNKTGQAVITVKALSGELTVITSFNVLVTTTDQLVVLNPVQPVMVDKNAPDTVIDLSNVFYNMADPNAQIVITVTGNSNSSLISASISGKDLTLGFAPEQRVHQRLRCMQFAEVLSVDHTFLVGVGNVDLLAVTISLRTFRLAMIL